MQLDHQNLGNTQICITDNVLFTFSCPMVKPGCKEEAATGARGKGTRGKSPGSPWWHIGSTRRTPRSPVLTVPRACLYLRSLFVSCFVQRDRAEIAETMLGYMGEICGSWGCSRLGQFLLLGVAAICQSQAFLLPPREMIPRLSCPTVATRTASSPCLLRVAFVVGAAGTIRDLS